MEHHFARMQLKTISLIPLIDFTTQNSSILMRFGSFSNPIATQVVPIRTHNRKVLRTVMKRLCSLGWVCVCWHVVFSQWAESLHNGPKPFSMVRTYLNWCVRIGTTCNSSGIIIHTKNTYCIFAKYNNIPPIYGLQILWLLNEWSQIP
jgi:hypothetical protein